MVRLDAGMLMVALQALLVSCGSGSHQPEPPAVVPAPAPAPAVQPQGGSGGNSQPPSNPSPKADPKTAPKDSSGNYPWQSGPIAEL